MRRKQETPKATRSAAASATAAERVEMWPLGRVHANPLNPRGELDPDTLLELAASIREKGVLTPLLAAPRGRDVRVVAGHRRRTAAALAGLKEVPVIVHDFTDGEQLEIMLVENLQREDLTPLQEAKGYQVALGGRGTKADLARRLGVPLHRVESRLELLRLDPAVQKIFDRQDLPISLAPPLLGISDPAEQRRVAALAMQRRLTVAQLGDFVRGSIREKGTADVRTSAHPAARPRPSPRGGKTAALPRAAAALTRSEARALLSGGGAATFEAMDRALENACDGRDERQYPEICRACPLPQFVGSLVREVSGGGEEVRGQEA